MNKTCVVAADLGSSACKTMVIRVDGRVLGSAQQEIRTDFPRPGWVEQNPEDWYQAFCTTVRQAMKHAAISAGEVAGVGIVGVTHNAVLVDKSGQPLRPSILVFDTRSSKQVDEIQNRWGTTIREKTLNDVSTLWTWPQLLWIRQNAPEVWRATHRVLFEKDYVRNRLAASPVTDTIDASGSLLYDPVNNEWIEQFYQDLGASRDWLPGVVLPTDVVATIGREGAADTGLAVGTPVIAGTTDTAAEVLGSGALRPNTGVIKLASVGRIAVVAAEPMPALHILNYRHVLDGLWYPGTASKYAASCYRWLRDILGFNNPDFAVYAKMDAAAARVPTGSEGLIFHPHLNGEWAPYWDNRMRGDFIGLTAKHTHAHLARSVLEGVAFGLKDAFGAMEKSGLKANELRLIGNGARSKLWPSIVANILNQPLRVTEQSDAVYGAALIVAMGVGAIEETPDSLESIIRFRESIEPQPDVSSRYETLYDIYRDSDRALRDVTSRLHEFERN